MGMNVTAYARHRGVSHVAVLKAIKAGRIVKEADGTIDPAKADAAWKQNTNQAQQRKPKDEEKKPAPHVAAELPVNNAPAANSGPSYAQSRAFKEAYNARLAKLEYEEKSGALVRTDSVKVDRMAPLLAAETDPKIVRELLDTELRQILNDVADTTAGLSPT